MARGEGGIKKNKFLKWNVLAHHGVISSIGLIRVLKRATYGNTCSLSSTKRLTWTSIHYNICYPTIWCQWCQQYSYNNSYSSEALQALTAYLYIIMLFVKKEFSCKSDQQFTENCIRPFFYTLMRTSENNLFKCWGFQPVGQNLLFYATYDHHTILKY